ncbi:MAG: hydrolase 1, exosortase A system-associated [Alteraurantiacibacter sp.]
MIRRHLTFPCNGETLVGTLDQGEKRIGLLIVTGGNELRAGAFGGQAQLAQRISAKGYPVFRFDRRGVGDSTGENREFRSAGLDITSALATFRSETPQVERIIGFGICDGAAALMLDSGAGCNALVLANPWSFDEETGNSMSAEAIRKRYAAKLSDPREWARFAKGKVSLNKLAEGLRRAVAPAPPPSTLVAELRAGLAAFDGPAQILIGERDRTGSAFANVWGEDARIATRAGADHAFSAAKDREWLEMQLLAALHEEARQLDMGRP